MEVYPVLELTGERYIPEAPGAQIHYEHLHRYALANQLVKGKKVLDLACGEGYGSKMLAIEAESVIGIDDYLRIKMQQSITLRAQAKYQRLSEKFLHPGSRKRFYYELGLTGVRVILTEGWRSFCYKSRQWILEHFIYKLKIRLSTILTKQSTQKTNVKIAAVTMVYNEALILPFFLNHYGYLDEIHVLYETDTTDESLAILSQASNVIIEKCHINGGIDDFEKIKIINNTVQNIKADWVYVVDPDEFVFPPNGETPNDFLRRQTRNVVRSGMFQVYRNRNDKDLNPALPPVPQRIHGDPDLSSIINEANRASNTMYIKPNIVRPLKEIRFLPGHHQIEGNPPTSNDSYVGAHWQMADPSIALKRRMERRARISERNKAYKMGWQHWDITEAAITKECEKHLDDPIIPELQSFNKTTLQTQY
jgi:hypothetical protein